MLVSAEYMRENDVEESGRGWKKARLVEMQWNEMKWKEHTNNVEIILHIFLLHFNPFYPSGR